MKSPAHILLINTALEEASIAWCMDGRVVSEKINTVTQEHAGFVQPAIESLTKEINVSLPELDAVAVMNGPGSYTGLRVGLASAKGICYALNKPLITINTLHWIAYGNQSNQVLYIVPMIDARRMEVFTAQYTMSMQCISKPEAKILDEKSFSELLELNQVVFVGNGSQKWSTICKHPHALFPEPKHTSQHFAELAYQLHVKNNYADLAYSEPEYTKAFYSTAKK